VETAEVWVGELATGYPGLARGDAHPWRWSTGSYFRPFPLSHKGKMMKATARLVIGIVFAACLVGCDTSTKSGKGFTLPDGNLEKGKEAYVSLQCNACHKVDGIEQLVVEGEKPAVSIALGGEVTRIQTYGELVTSIINPSHRLAAGHPAEEVAVEGTSKMKNFNDVMTVAQLTDLVSFLQSKYKLKVFEPTYYPLY
jgi:sulfur-oxidizing protein SoxX